MAARKRRSSDGRYQRVGEKGDYRDRRRGWGGGYRARASTGRVTGEGEAVRGPPKCMGRGRDEGRGGGSTGPGRGREEGY